MQKMIIQSSLYPAPKTISQEQNRRRIARLKVQAVACPLKLHDQRSETIFAEARKLRSDILRTNQLHEEDESEATYGALFAYF